MSKSTQARKQTSVKMQTLLNEITPLEMEQTKVKMQLAARMADLVEAKGWNKSQFAEKVGKNPSEITKWLSGTHNFTIEVLTEIAFALGVEVGVLLGKKQVQTVYKKEIVVSLISPQPGFALTTPVTHASMDYVGHFLSTIGKRYSFTTFNDWYND